MAASESQAIVPGDISPPHTCVYCETLLLDLVPPTRWNPETANFELQHGAYWAPYVPEESYFGRLTVRDVGALLCTVEGDVVITGAENGCDFLKWCRDLHEAKQTRSMGSGRFQISLRATGLDFPRFTLPRSFLKRIRAFSRSFDGAEDEFGHLTILEDLGITTGRDSDAAKYIPFHTLHESPVCPGAVDLWNKWLNTCLTEHGEMCGTSGPGYVPSLLIHIEPSKTGPKDGPYFKLVTRSEALEMQPKPQYVALSYRWGQAENLTTTKETLATFRSRIDATIIPRTILEALSVASHLGYAFLWVDALCIVQNENEAIKAKEIASMDEVYGHAAFTISAAVAESVHESFFHRSPNAISGFQLKLQTPDRQTCPVVLMDEDIFQLSFLKGWSEDLIDPVDTRAWTLQESMLSVAVLSFSSVGLFWECRSALWAENLDNAMMNEEMEGQRVMQALPLSDKEMYKLRFTWHKFVERYTRRRIGLHTDRLPALAGLARRISGLTRDKYAAGLWQNTILGDLLWYCPKTKPLDLGEANLGQPSKRIDFKTPSWSWASVENATDFVTPSNHEEIKLHAALISVDVKPISAENYFGQVDSGVLCIRGPLREARWVGEDRGQVFLLDYGQHIDAFPDALEDTIDQSGMHNRVWCLEITEGPMGLVLVAMQSGVYRRVGAFGRLETWKTYSDHSLWPIEPMIYWKLTQKSNQPAEDTDQSGQINALSAVEGSQSVDQSQKHSEPTVHLGNKEQHQDAQALPLLIDDLDLNEAHSDEVSGPYKEPNNSARMLKLSRQLLPRAVELCDVTII